MSEKKEKIKYPGFINKIWHDPVWSKIIYAGLIFLAGLVYSFFATLFKNISFYDAFVETINYNLPLYTIFIILALGLLLYGILYKIRQKRKRHIGRFDVEQKVGNFTFRELYNSLLTHQIEATLQLHERKMDLLTLFVLFQRQFNLGVEWQGDHFSYYTLGPLLMSYGLTERAPTTNKLDSVGSDIIQTSQIGFEFYALLEKFRVYNDENMEEDVSKSGEPNKPPKSE